MFDPSINLGTVIAAVSVCFAVYNAKSSVNRKNEARFNQLETKVDMMFNYFKLTPNTETDNHRKAAGR